MLTWNEGPPVVFEVPRVDDDQIDDLFYQEDEIGDMRHMAFMIECGLEEDPPDGPDVDPVPWKPEQLLKQQQQQQQQLKDGKSTAPTAPPKKLERTASLDALDAPKSPRRKRLVATKSGTLHKVRAAPDPPKAEKKSAKKSERSNSVDDINIEKSPMSPRRSRLVATKSGTLHGMRAAVQKVQGEEDDAAPVRAASSIGLRRGKKSDIMPNRSNSAKTTNISIAAELLKAEGTTAADSGDAAKPRSRPTSNSSGIKASRTVSCSGMSIKQRRKDRSASTDSSGDECLTQEVDMPEETDSPRRPVPMRGSGLVQTRSGTNLKKVRRKDDANTSSSSKPTPVRGSGLGKTQSGSDLKRVKRQDRTSSKTADDLTSVSTNGTASISSSTNSKPTPVRGSGLGKTQSGSDLKRVKRADRVASATSGLRSISTMSQASTSSGDGELPATTTKKSKKKNGKSKGYKETPTEPKRIMFKNGKRVEIEPTPVAASTDDDDDDDSSVEMPSSDSSDDVSISTSEDEDDAGKSGSNNGPINVTLAKWKKNESISNNTPTSSKPIALSRRSSVGPTDGLTPDPKKKKKDRIKTKSTSGKVRSTSITSAASTPASSSMTSPTALSVGERMKAFQKIKKKKAAKSKSKSSSSATSSDEDGGIVPSAFRTSAKKSKKKSKSKSDADSNVDVPAAFR